MPGHVLLSDGTDFSWVNTNTFLDHTLTSTWLDIQGGSSFGGSYGSGDYGSGDYGSGDGGSTNEYYHISNAEHGELTGWLDSVVLSSNGDVNLVAGDLICIDITAEAITGTSFTDGTLSIAGGELTTTGNCAFGNVEPYYDDTSYLGHQSWRWKGLFLSDNANIGGTIDLGTNTITDGTMVGDWDFSAGNLITTGTVKAEQLTSTDDITANGIILNNGGIIRSNNASGPAFLQATAAAGNDASLWLREVVGPTRQGGALTYDGGLDDFFIGTISSNDALTNAIKIDQDSAKVFALGDMDVVGNYTSASGDIGLTGTRITKGWFTDLEVTNAIAGSITGNAATATALETARDIGGVSFDGTASIVPTTIVVADTNDTTCFVGLWESATGSLLPKTDGALLYNAGTGTLAVGFGDAGDTFKLSFNKGRSFIGYVAGKFTIEATGGRNLLFNTAADTTRMKIYGGTGETRIGNVDANYTAFSSTGAISQAGSATLTLQDGSDLIITANDDAGPFLSSTQSDTSAGTITAAGFTTAGTITDGTLSIVGGEILDATTLEATTTLGIEIGDVQQLVLTDGSLLPTTDNDVTLGSTAKRWTDLYLSNNFGVGINYAPSGVGVAEISGRLVLSDGGGASRWAMNLESNTAATNYASINVFDYNATAAGTLVLQESGGSIGIGTFSPDTRLQVVGTAGFGDDAGNETLFASDGLQTMAGTARVIISIDLEPVLATRPAANPPGEGTEDSFPTHDFNPTTDESVFFHLELSHDYADAGLIHVHFDFFVDTAPAGAQSVVWGVEYKKQSIGDNFDFGAGTTTAYTQTSVTTGTPANDKKVHQSSEISLTTTGFVAGDYILLRLFRDANGTGGTDDFPGDARIIDYHIEYLSDKLGEAT